VPAGYYSDDEYVSEEDEKDSSVVVPLLAPKFQGVQPPPSIQDISVQPTAKNTSKSSLPTAFAWTRNSCALRAAGTDPVTARKEFVKANVYRNMTGKNSGKESRIKNSALATREHGAGRNNSDDDAPFGVPPKSRTKTQTDATNWAWVEKVLQIKNRESTAPRTSLEVRKQSDLIKLELMFKPAYCFIRYEFKINIIIMIFLML